MNVSITLFSFPSFLIAAGIFVWVAMCCQREEQHCGCRPVQVRMNESGSVNVECENNDVLSL